MDVLVKDAGVSHFAIQTCSMHRSFKTASAELAKNLAEKRIQICVEVPHPSN